MRIALPCWLPLLALMSSVRDPLLAGGTGLLSWLRTASQALGRVYQLLVLFRIHLHLGQHKDRKDPKHCTTHPTVNSPLRMLKFALEQPGCSERSVKEMLTTHIPFMPYGLGRRYAEFCHQCGGG